VARMPPPASSVSSARNRSSSSANGSTKARNGRRTGLTSRPSAPICPPSGKNPGPATRSTTSCWRASNRKV
jgi:hypothetical protein